jgi:hypothetical protein
MPLIWLTNSHKDYDRVFIKHMLADGKVTGGPKSTKEFSVDELRKMGMIGLYKIEGADVK